MNGTTLKVMGRLYLIKDRVAHPVQEPVGMTYEVEEIPLPHHVKLKEPLLPKQDRRAQPQYSRRASPVESVMPREPVKVEAPTSPVAASSNPNEPWFKTPAVGMKLKPLDKRRNHVVEILGIQEDHVVTSKGKIKLARLREYAPA